MGSPYGFAPEWEEVSVGSANAMELDSEAPLSVGVLPQDLDDDSMFQTFEAEFFALKQRLSIKEEGLDSQKELESLCKQFIEKSKSRAGSQDHGTPSDSAAKCGAPSIATTSAHIPLHKRLVYSKKAFGELATLAVRLLIFRLIVRVGPVPLRVCVKRSG
jgi:hypothetical protein